MNRKLKKFLETEFQSKAQVLDRRMVEVVAPDGEIFHINSTIGAYDSEDTQRYYLHVIESGRYLSQDSGKPPGFSRLT